ncbi:MAG: copper-binding protein [Gemmatimonadaceae bacterium]
MRLLPLGAVLCVLGCSAADAAVTGEPRTHDVTMRAVSFTPKELVVAVGDTVQWVNADIVRHNAVRPGLFDTGELRPGDKYGWVPSDTGEVSYQCTIHQRMRAKVTVVARSARE